jgi:hypothetical protein
VGTIAIRITGLLFKLKKKEEEPVKTQTIQTLNLKKCMLCRFSCMDGEEVIA